MRDLAMAHRPPTRLAGAMAFALLITLFAPSALAEGECYIKAYNELVRMLVDRSRAAGLSTNGLNTLSVESGDSVTQSQLQSLRTRAISLLGYYVVEADGFNLSTNAVDDAFPTGRRYDAGGYLRLPSLMSDIGVNGRFTKVPAQFVSSNVTICADNFTDVPLLWVHFDEIYRLARKMNRTRVDGSWTANGQLNQYDASDGGASKTNVWDGPGGAKVVFVENIWGPDPDGSTNNGAPYATTYGVDFASASNVLSCSAYGVRRASYCQAGPIYNGTSVAGGTLLHVAHFYNYAREVPLNWGTIYDSSFAANGDAVAYRAWTKWDASSSANSQSTNLSAILGHISSAFDLAWCDEPQYQYQQYGAKTLRGYQVDAGVAVIEWANLYTPDLANPAQDDPETDGLSATGCECTDCTPDADPEWRSMRADAHCRFPLGLSSGLQAGGLRVKAYVTEYKVDGIPLDMFSLDTAVLSHPANAGEGWEFAVVKRPSGAEVVFPMRPNATNHPAYSANRYWIVSANGGLELRFPGPDNTVHRFGSDNKIQQVRRRIGSADVVVNGSPTAWPGMATFKDASGHITSNRCPIIEAYPQYTGRLITEVAYSNRGSSCGVRLRPGSRILQVTDANGAVTRESRIVSTVDGEEIWEGVVTNGALTVARKRVRTQSYDASNELVIVTESAILDPDTESAASNVTRRVLGRYPWGRAVTAETRGYGGADPQTTTYTYATNAADTNSYGLLQLVQAPGGEWKRYEYDAAGRETVRVTPFKNAAPDAATNDCRVTRSYYAGDPVLAGLAFPSDDVAVMNDTRPRLVVDEIAGREVARTYSAYLPGCSVTKRCTTAGAAYDAGDNLVTLSYMHTNGTFQGRPSKSVNEDGTLAVFSYSYDSGSEQLTTTVESGAGSGSTVTSGTRTITVVDGGNRTLSSRTEDIASGLTISSTVYVRDGFGRPIAESNTVTGAFITRQYGCCGVANETDEEGIETATTYNELKQVFATERLGVTTYYTYDVEGRGVGTRRSAAGEADIVTVSVYDELGRLCATTNELGAGTSYSYATNSAGEAIVTTVLPDGATRVETRYRDGQVRTIDGTAVHPTCFDYGADEDGAYTIEYKGTNANAAEWVKTWRDLLGRTWKTVYPDGYTRTSSFDGAGRAIGETDGFSVTLTAHNDLGEGFRTALDLNGNNAIDLDGVDRVSEQESGYVSVADKAARETETRVYPSNGVATALAVAVNRATLDGAESWSIAYGRTNHTAVSRDRAHAARTETVTRPDGTQTITSYASNRLVSIVQKDAAGVTLSTRTFAYDPFGRQVEAAEPAASGETRTTVSRYDAAGRLTNQVVSAGSLQQSTSHSYDAMGRRVQTVLPDGGTVSYTYNTRGELTQQSGAQTYPVTYTYTDQGRMSSMSTYRAGLGGGADTTTLGYDAQRGWLAAKVYADSSAVEYEYQENGVLKRRTWARGVTTDYAYDPAGGLTNVAYSDGTPGVEYAFDRLGRVVGVSDGVGVWTSAFEPDGQAAGGAVPQLPGWALAYGYDTLGRMTNVTIRDAAGVGVYGAGYAYDAAGRLAAVSGGAGPAVYAYGPDGLTWTNLAFGSALRVDRAFDGLNRLTEIANRPAGGGPVSSVYAYDQVNRRTSRTLGDEAQWRYEYNERGEVVSGRKYYADGTPAGGAQFGYAFDTIGNRTEATSGWLDARRAAYEANELNQYETRDVPGVVDVTGEAETNAAVSVRLDSGAVARLANRHGRAFWLELAATNAGTVFWSSNVQAIARVAQGTQSLVRVESRPALLAATPEEFAYDADGNLLADGLWTNAWDGENRLIRSESRAEVPDAARRRVSNVYDYMGRRVRKTVESGYAGGGYAVTGTTTFVYDGWNLIVEIGAGSGHAQTNRYVWGSDLSGTRQGAGGIGGLVSLSVGGTNLMPSFDANGNVVALVSDAGDVEAEYEYGPFGEPLAATGPAAAANPFRFSTKYTDPDTGRIYYGYRYYDPPTGRWLSRDPIAERGGRNLYAFVRNCPVSRHDYLGLSSYSSVLDGDVFYTWHMGWIDKTHAYSKNDSLVKAWQSLKSTAQGTVVNFCLSMAQGSGRLTYKNSSACFCVNAKASEEAKKQQLLCAWKRISEQFEAYQDAGLQGSGYLNGIFGIFGGEVDKKPSGFSSEDLVSNLIQFYAIVDSTSADALVRQYAGVAIFDDDGYLSNLTADLSQGVWQFHPVRPGWRQWTPDYADYKAFIDRDLSGVDDEGLRSILERTQGIFESLLDKYGPPKFPDYFQKYKTDCDGVSVTSESNTGHRK